MINVAITGLNAADSPAPGVPVVRCLREHSEWDGRIIALAYDAFESGILDRNVADSAYLLPYPKTGSEALLERIKNIHERERIDVIIPNLDSELLNFITIEEELSGLGIRLFIPTEQQFKKRSKSNLPRFAKEAGINVPETTLVHDSLDPAIGRMSFPVMVKGVFYEAYLVHSPEEASHYVRKIAANWGYPVLLQKHIEGDEYNGVALGDGMGDVVGAAYMKKLVFTDKRKGWACVSIENDGLIELTRTIIASLNWRGPMEVEAIYSAADKCFYLIEVNPRFPAWIYLAKAAGVNLPYACLQLGLGRSVVSKPVHRSGVVFSNYTTNLVTDLATISSLFTKGELHYEKTV